MVALVIYSISVPAVARQNVTAPPFQRKTIDLNGEWEFKKKGEDNWHKILIPANIKESGSFFFRRSFRLPPLYRDAQFNLIFQGINFSSRIKVNGQYLATQNHGFTVLHITVDSDLLRFAGDNTIEVEVNTKLSKNTIPLQQSLFQPEPLRGIFRDVSLQILPPVAIIKLQNQVTFSAGYQSASVACNFQLQTNPGSIQPFLKNLSDLRLRLVIYAPGSAKQIVFSAVHAINRTELETESVNIPVQIQQPKLWRPARPNLYSVQASLEYGAGTVDRFITHLGLRKIGLQKNKILLNEKTFVLRGIRFIETERHYLSPVYATKLLKSIKSLGLNTVSWFFPPPPSVLAKADSLGLFSMICLPVWNSPAGLLENEGKMEMSLKLTQKLLTLLSGHPSVLGLSLGHGYDGRETRTFDYIKKVRGAVPSSSSFLITAGFRNFDHLSADLPLDFVSIDLTGRYPVRLDTWLEKWVVDHPGVPVLIDEVSFAFIHNVTDSESVSIFETNQAYRLKQTIQRLLNRPVLGYSLGNVYDWQGTYLTLLSPGVPQESLFPFGIAFLDGTPRMAWSMIQNLNSGKQDQFSFPKPENPVSQTSVFIFFGLGIILFFLYFFRKDHKLRGNLIRVFSRPAGFHLELKEGRKVPLRISVIVLITEIMGWALIFISFFYFFRQHPLFDFWLAEIIPFEKIHLLLIYMSWQPILGLFGFSLLLGVIALLLVGYVRGLSLVSGTNLSIRNVFTFLSWEGSIFIFLLPLALVFYRLLFFKILLIPLFLLLFLFSLWYFYRLYIGVITIFTVPGWRAFLYVFLVPLILLSVFLLIMDHGRSICAQSEYLFHVWQSGF